MRLEFFKMHGAGNDYVFVDMSRCCVLNPTEIAKKVSKRRFSIGSDGLILISPSARAHCKMTVFNSDGSEGKTCGNGLRCVAKYLYDEDICKTKTIFIETSSGVHAVNMATDEEGNARNMTVDMGEYVINSTKINDVDVTVIKLENLHAVVFYNDNMNTEKIAFDIQNSEYFSDSVNVEFVKVVDDRNIDVRVYERGSGETLSCGSGACAAAIAYFKTYSNISNKITVHMPGGDLDILINDGNVALSGDAEFVFYGECDI